MLALVPQVPPVPALQAAVPLGVLVDAIGTESFGTCLVQLLHQVCGAEHCTVFQFEAESIRALTTGSFDPAHAVSMVERYMREGLWRHDPAMLQARARSRDAAASVIRVDLDDLSYAEIRSRVYPHVRDRIVISGKREKASFGLSVTRSSSFDRVALDQLANLSDTLLAAMAKHVDVLAHKPNVGQALTCLDEIERCFTTRSGLPRRELEVCARILYGLSSVGISLDLNIGEESVKTYRKRAYQRLQIGSERELLHWYLAQWSAWRGHLHTPVNRALH